MPARELPPASPLVQLGWMPRCLSFKNLLMRPVPSAQHGPCMRAITRTSLVGIHLRQVCRHTQRAAGACNAARLPRASGAWSCCQPLSRGARPLSALAQQPNMGSQSLHRALNTYWGFSAFRSCQEDVIRSVLEGQDNLVVMVRCHCRLGGLRRPIRAHMQCVCAGDRRRQVAMLSDTCAGHPAALHSHLAAHLPHAGPGALHTPPPPRPQPVHSCNLLRLQSRRCWR